MSLLNGDVFFVFWYVYFAININTLKKTIEITSFLEPTENRKFWEPVTILKKTKTEWNTKHCK